MARLPCLVLLFLVLFSLSPTLASTSSSSSSSPSDPLPLDESQPDPALALNFSLTPSDNPLLQQQQHVFAVNTSPPSESESEFVKENQSTMCNKAASNPNRVVLPTNVTPSHYTLTITPDFKEFTFGGYVEIE